MTADQLAAATALPAMPEIAAAIEGGCAVHDTRGCEQRERPAGTWLQFANHTRLQGTTFYLGSRKELQDASFLALR
jgi:hypothetical protein